MTRVVHPFLCSVCGKARETDFNRWWLVWIEEKQEVIGGALVDFSFLCVMPWADWMAERDVEHACGQECMQTLVERWAVKRALT